MDRRRQYRVDTEEPPIEVFVVPSSGGGRTEAELVNLALGGALVRVPPISELVVPIGGELFLHLRDRGTGREANVRSRLVHRHDQGRSRTLGVQFLDIRAAEELLTPAVARLFNRRGAFRVFPSAEEPDIAVTLQIPGEPTIPLQPAPLRDLSTGGMCVDVPARYEAAIARHDAVECMLLLPGDRMPLAVTGQIRHRTMRADSVRYGLMYIDTEGPAFAKAFDSILNYVLKRQRELGVDIESGRAHVLELLRAGGAR